MVKNSFALHPKMKMTMMSGMTVHVISSFRFPWMGTPASSAARRRYLIAKYTTSPR